MRKLLASVERVVRPFAIPHLTPLIVVGQGICFVLIKANPQFGEKLLLVPGFVAAGQLWRLFSFLFLPPSDNLLFAFFGWYLFWLMGTVLENQWGPLRFNVFLLISYVATVAVVFLAGIPAMTNVYVFATVFLAFAFYYPDFVLSLFFVLPVPIRFLAAIQWLVYGYQFVAGPMATRLLIAASLANFFVFFGQELFLRAKARSRQISFERRVAASRNQVFHRCAVCGATERSHPQEDFRYCTQCEGDYEYCQEHLRNHEHQRAATGSPLEH